MRDITVTLPGRRAAKVQDVSATGVLLETPQRLCPGRGVEILISYGARQVLLVAIVMRATLRALKPEPIYRVALQFDSADLIDVWPVTRAFERR